MFRKKIMGPQKGAGRRAAKMKAGTTQANFGNKPQKKVAYALDTKGASVKKIKSN